MTSPYSKRYHAKRLSRRKLTRVLAWLPTVLPHHRMSVYMLGSMYAGFKREEIDEAARRLGVKNDGTQWLKPTENA